MAGSFGSKWMRSLPFVRNVRQRLEQAPKLEVEDSLLLRVLTLVMVVVGIIATDVAAETQISVWAIPLSFLGGYWSWSHRRSRNVITKFCIAIGMLLALGSFLFGLRENINDTRIILAELLIQLQVLHSFHMPRRQDLGYSMIIGLILIGVASTLSQTMVFGVLLLAFLAIALPVLVLDYRSRLNLLGSSYPAPFRRAGLSLQRLGLFLAIILTLGLSLFLVMPRLPGYQLRTFPVSGQINQDFQDNQQIVNPGYVRQGNRPGGTGTGAGQGQTTGPGQVDETYYYGFGSRINQNLRGQMKPKLVMRVRSQAKSFWRVMAFDRYLGQGWEISRNDKTKTVERPAWSYQFYLSVPITLNRQKEVIQTYSIVSDLPNLIPAMTYPKELYFPTPQVAMDTEGSLRSPVGLPEGLTYTVVSSVPYRDRTRLRQASTQHGPQHDIYLDVPAKIRARVRAETEALLATAANPLTDPYEKALYLAQTLKQRYALQPEMPYLDPNEDLVEAFLFKYKGGYPDHFSTALTIMLRSIGIPARLIVGYAPGDFNPFTGLYEVKNTDAYAMTEVHFPKFGWFAFDPIPSHELIPPSIEEDQTFGVLQQFWNWVAGWLPSPVSNFLSRVFSNIFGWIVGFIAWLVSLFQQGWVGLFTLLLLGIGLAFGGWLLWQAWRKWRYQRWLQSLPAVESLYHQMTDWLATQGMGKQAAQTPFEYVRQAQEKQPAHRAALIEHISSAYVEWRYGGRSPDLTELRQALQNLKQKPPRSR